MSEDERRDVDDIDADDALVLGRELAAAFAAEELHVPPGPSPIADVEYPVGAADLWRWVDCPQDATMTAFVSAYAAADEGRRATMRASLSMDDLYKAVLFARRRAFAAIRTGDAQAVVEAFDALSVLDIKRMDWRDAVVASMLASYSASRAGVAATKAAAGAIGRSSPPVAEVLSHAVSSDTVDLAESCGYRLVTTADGPALFEHGYKAYKTKRDLVPIALSLAAAIEEDRAYRVERLGIGDDIPRIWITVNADAQVPALQRLTGCLSVNADPITGPSEHFLMVFLAEAATAEDAATIAQSASREGGREGSVVLGVAADRLCAVLVAACVTYGKPSLETAETLARFLPAITDLLG